MKLNLFSFVVVVVYTSGVIQKKPLPYPRSWRFTPMLSSKTFIVLALTLGSLIHFELLLLFCVWREGGYDFILLYVDLQSSWDQLLKRLFFPHSTVLAALSKSLVHEREDSFPGSWFPPSIYTWTLVPIPGRPNCCSFVGSFSIGRCDSTLFSFFQIVLALLHLLHFHNNFNVCLSISARKASGFSRGIVLDL